jgi:hypothetical protein
VNRNFAIVLGFGAFVVLILALLLKKGPTSYQLGDIGSKVTLPVGGADEATIKSAIASVLKPFDPKPTPPVITKYSVGVDPLLAWSTYHANLAAWTARNP